METADIIVGHNVTYDIDVLFYELQRISLDSQLESQKHLIKKKAHDTMVIGTNLCKIP